MQASPKANDTIRLIHVLRQLSSSREREREGGREGGREGRGGEGREGGRVEGGREGGGEREGRTIKKHHCSGVVSENET